MMRHMGQLPTELTEQDFKKIIARRDVRYDGRFLFGVRTTKIYCRVICPARPKPENIVIFKSHSEAERQGYRPCLRCRPDAAPGSVILNGTSNTVARALRLIESNDDFSVDQLADRLGVTDRHLRRLFEEHLGASPIEIMITKRLHLAKRLILETERPISEIALAVGFQSIRRFNDAFRSLFSQAPSVFRKKRRAALDVETDAIRFSLIVRAPYDWETVLAYLKRHEAFGIERVESNRYTRFVIHNGKPGVIRVEKGSRETELSVSVSGLPLTTVRPTLEKIGNLFDVGHNPAHLPKLMGRAGIRVPGSFDELEVAVSIILSQLVSTVQARMQLRKLIERFGGHHGQFEGQDVFSFPRTHDLIHAAIEEIGLTKTKANAIRELARAYDARTIDLTTAADVAETRARLLAIKGIGPWTVEMIAMRCLRDPDAFPSGDLIVRRVLDAKLVDEREWRSSRAYLTHRIWRDLANVTNSSERRNL